MPMTAFGIKQPKECWPLLLVCCACVGSGNHDHVGYELHTLHDQLTTRSIIITGNVCKFCFDNIDSLTKLMYMWAIWPKLNAIIIITTNYV